MKIAVDRLLAEGFGLELPNEGAQPTKVDITRGTGLRGTYAHGPEEIHLDTIAADELDAALADVVLGVSSRLVSAPLVAKGLTMDCKIARGALLRGRVRFGGKIGARELAAKSVALDLGAQHIRASALDATQIAWSNTATEGMTTRLARVAAQTLSLALSSAAIELGAVSASAVSYGSAGKQTLISIGAVEARAGRVQLGATSIGFEGLTANDVKVVLGGGAPSITAASLTARGVELQASGVGVRIDQVRLSKGVSYEGGNLTALAVSIGEVAVELPSLAPSAPRAKPAAEPAAPSKPIDFRFLDGLMGRVEVDVTVDAKVPIIKRRVATHELRVSIDQGIIDFKELERGLSLLEDAILDFEFEGDRLILEKDLPLVPFDNVTLVYWMLDDEGKKLAADRRVRLRTLVSPELPDKPKSEGGGGKSAFELQRLDMDPIAATLRLSGPSRVVLPNGTSIRLGAEGRPAIGELTVRGALRHRPLDPAEPGQVEAGATEILVGMHNLPLGGRTLSIDALAIGALTDARLTTQGFKPVSARATLRGVEVANVVMTSVSTAHPR